MINDNLGVTRRPNIDSSVKPPPGGQTLQMANPYAGPNPKQIEKNYRDTMLLQLLLKLVEYEDMTEREMVEQATNIVELAMKWRAEQDGD